MGKRSPGTKHDVITDASRPYSARHRIRSERGNGRLRRRTRTDIYLSMASHLLEYATQRHMLVHGPALRLPISKRFRMVARQKACESRRAKLAPTTA